MGILSVLYIFDVRIENRLTFIERYKNPRFAFKLLLWR